MCGIAGLVSASRIDPKLLRRMSGAIIHRGPDDEGSWIDQEAGVGFAHRRLSIVDLSPHGHQPMHSADGRFVLNYNGEIYNHGAIRAELDAAGLTPPGGWRGHSDTEALVEAIAAWGLPRAIGKAAGMFALALWDRQERKLSLARDRFGEKPLYYGWVGRDFVFASELKAIRRHPGFEGEIDRDALAHYAARAYVAAPRSIYRRMFKLPPATILTLTTAEALRPSDEPPRGKVYWSYHDVVRAGLADPIGAEEEALSALDAVLAKAIGGQSIADVAVGAFLSGGIDSSLVTALYQRHSGSQVRTFSIGFEEAAYNEADYARAVARYLGTEHHEHVVTVAEARGVIPLLPKIYDEPFADSSQIPTFLVSRFAREHVTVALTGDGGDELFAGYNRHFQAPRLWARLQRVPRPVRSAAGAVLAAVPHSLWHRAAGLLPLRHRYLGKKSNAALGRVLANDAPSFGHAYDSFLDEWYGERSPVLGAGAGAGGSGPSLGGGAPDPAEAMYRDAVGYLPDDILCKVDRASMAVSLETRVPFLDHRVAEVAARIPLDLKISQGEGKHILRQLLFGHLPEQLFDRPKAGFAIPVGQWIKGPLRPWAEELLNSNRLASDGLLDTSAVRRRWADHLSGRRDSTHAIWAVLMFQAWLDNQSPATELAA